MAPTCVVPLARSARRCSLPGVAEWRVGAVARTQPSTRSILAQRQPHSCHQCSSTSYILLPPAEPLCFGGGVGGVLPGLLSPEEPDVDHPMIATRSTTPTKISSASIRLRVHEPVPPLSSPSLLSGTYFCPRAGIVETSSSSPPNWSANDRRLGVHDRTHTLLEYRRARAASPQAISRMRRGRGITARPLEQTGVHAH
jgi:hypothetical protein